MQQQPVFLRTQDMLPPQGTAAFAQQENAYRLYLQAYEAIYSMNSPGEH